MGIENLDIGLFTVFVVLTVINVILQTARTIITIKGGMFLSALTNALAFGFYTVMIIYMVCELPMWMKAVVTALANFVGVYIVKYAEMWLKKDRLWVIDVIIYAKRLKSLRTYLNECEIQFTELPIENSDSKLFHIYSNTQSESRKIKDILESFGAKYFVSESKSL